MTRETKVGLMMVALLVGVFGFLLYKRIHKPLESLASQESTDAGDTDAGDIDSPERGAANSRRDQNDFLAFERPSTKPNDRPVPSKSKSNDEFSSSLLDNEPEFVEPTPVRRRLKPPVLVKSDEDEFDQVIARQTTKKKPLRENPIEPSDDAFGDSATPKQKSSRAVLQAAATSDSDPFPDEVPGVREKAGTAAESDSSPQTLTVPATIEEEERETQTESNPIEASVPFNTGRPAQVPSKDVLEDTTGRQPGLTGRPVRVQQTSDFENGLVASPRTERRAAPVSLDERSFSPEASPKGSVTGPSYVIEPNDNFWTISRKRYGVGRYYMALARHNQQIIPDPKRIKPGITISTPEAAQLEQRYADLIPKPAPADPAPAVVTTQSRKPEESAPAGFFVATDGTPMYRIAGQDTLSDIARSHLGRSSRWVQILEMNRNVLRDGNELKIGTVLRLPADASRVQIVGTPRQFR